MTLTLHSTILATSLAATLAVGLASAAVVIDHEPAVAAKSDRLPVVATLAPAGDYVTVETRRDGVSELARVPVN